MKKEKSEKVIRSISVGLAAMMALASPMTALAEETTQDTGSTTAQTQTSTESAALTQAKTAAEAAKTAETAALAAQKETNEVSDAITNGKNAGGVASGVISDIADTMADSEVTPIGMSVVTGLAAGATTAAKTELDTAVTKATETDAALAETTTKAEELSTIAENANQTQLDAQASLDTAIDTINSATTIAQAQSAYTSAETIVADAGTAVAQAQTDYETKLQEYEAAKQKLLQAQADYDVAINSASAAAGHAAEALTGAQEQVDVLKKAADDAKAAIEPLTDARNAALEIIKLEKDCADDEETVWATEDQLFEAIIKNYYVPNVYKGTLVSLDWTRNENNDKNYCTVTYKYNDAEGNEQTKTVYLNYSVNSTKDDLIIYEKTDVYVYTADGKEASFEVNNLTNAGIDLSKMNDQDTCTYTENGTTYTFVKVGDKLYVADSASASEETFYDDTEKYIVDNRDEEVVYSVDTNGKLVKTVKKNVTEITYTETSLTSDTYTSDTYASVEEAEQAMTAEKERLEAEGDKDVNLAVSATATATAEATATQTTVFTTTIDLSKVATKVDIIKNDGDDDEKDNAKKSAEALLEKVKSTLTTAYFSELLGSGYAVTDVSFNNLKVNSTKKYDGDRDSWVDWFKDGQRTFTGVLSGSVVVTYTQTFTETGTSTVSADKDSEGFDDVETTAKEEALDKAESAVREKTATSQNDAILNKVKSESTLSHMEKTHQERYKSWGKWKTKTVTDYKADFDFSNVTATTTALTDADSTVNSKLTVEATYSGTYNKYGTVDLGVQDTSITTYGKTSETNLEEHTSNANYNAYKEGGSTEGILLTGKDDEKFAAYKDDAETAKKEYDEKVAAADNIIKEAKEAQKAVEEAQTEVTTLNEKIGGLLETRNYTKESLSDLEAELSTAQERLQEALNIYEELQTKLITAQEDLATTITRLTPIPVAPVTTTVETTTTVAAADTTPLMFVNFTMPTVAGGGAARTTAVADADADADDAEAVQIADEETPLAATDEEEDKDDEKETANIADEETPLAASETEQKTGWWAALIAAIVAAAGGAGIYEKNRKKKLAENANDTTGKK